MVVLDTIRPSTPPSMAMRAMVSKSAGSRSGATLTNTGTCDVAARFDHPRDQIGQRGAILQARAAPVCWATRC